MEVSPLRPISQYCLYSQKKGVDTPGKVHLTVSQVFNACISKKKKKVNLTYFSPLTVTETLNVIVYLQDCSLDTQGQTQSW